MDFDFYPEKTKDGSIGLYSDTVGDIYHSSYGAYSEAYEKFINPSGFNEFILSNDRVSVLDVCYGIGYNTKSAIRAAMKSNADINIDVLALEIDPDVLAFSVLVEQSDFDDEIFDLVNLELLKNEKVAESFLKILQRKDFYSFFSSKSLGFLEELQKKGLSQVESQVKSANLHNIYYKYISGRNKLLGRSAEKRPKISFSLSLGDARMTIRDISTTFDFIFLDAFTPIKLPSLWSVEFFRELNRILKEGGNISTYSNSAAIRSGMLEAGLFVGKTSCGTIAYKLPDLVKVPLDDKSRGLLATNAGIPFYDPSLSWTTKQILLHRDNIASESGRVSTSRFLKDFQKGN